MSELLSCRWCGSRASVENTGLSMNGPFAFRAHCTNEACLARGPGRATPVEAKAAWADSPPAPAIDVEGVVTAVKLDICEWCAPSTVNDVEIAMRRAFRSALGGKEQR